MLHTLISLLFPKAQPIITIGTVEKFIQHTTLHPVVSSTSALQERGIHYLDSVYAACSYHKHPIVEQAICQGKFNNQPKLFNALAALLVAAPIKKRSVIMAVPLHWTRHFSRGFNQSTIIAKHIARTHNGTYVRNLKRIKPTGHQARRNRLQRLQAVQNAFTCSPIIATTVYIIDDICTTAATMDACAKALKAAGIQQVHGVTLAQS